MHVRQEEAETFQFAKKRRGKRPKQKQCKSSVYGKTKGNNLKAPLQCTSADSIAAQEEVADEFVDDDLAKNLQTRFGKLGVSLSWLEAATVIL